MLLVGLGMALGIGLSAVFLVPAMTTQDTLWFTTMNEDMFTYDQNFILAGSRTNERLTTPLHIEATEVVMICIALSAWLAVRVRTSGVSRRLVNFFAATAVVAFFMMTPISTPIWELVTPLQQLQFPWRFAPIVSLAVMVLLAFLVSSPGKPFAFTKLFPVALLVAAFAFFCIPAMAELTVMARSIGTVSVNRLMELLSPVSDERLIGIDRLKYEADVIEHLPRWVPRTPFVDRKYGYLAVAQLSRETPRASVVSGKGTIDVQQWGADGINLDVHGVSPVKIVIGQFYYPGWSGRLGDSGAELACGPSKPNGLLQCDVPAGNHSVTVIRTHTKPESIGIAISTLSLLIAAAVWLTGRRRATGEPARTGHIPVVPVEVTEMQK